jgi:hypothetical protein
MGIPNAGLAEMANLWGGVSTPLKMAYVMTGTSDTAFAAADTTLGTEIDDSGLQRVAVTATRTTTNVTNDTVQFVKTFTVTGTYTIKEVGIINASSTGDLGGRTVLATPKDVVNGSSYTLTHKTIFARE